MCETCRQRPEYKEIRRLATSYNTRLERKFGLRAFRQGGSLFLGKHYAASAIVVFTLNPGADPKKPQQKFAAGLYDYNHHWEESRADHRNWRFSKFFFESLFDVAPHFRRILAEATDAFLVPWRTPDSRTLENHEAWDDIQRYAARLLPEMLWHHNARLILVSGSKTLTLFERFLGLELYKAEVDVRQQDGKYRHRFDCKKFYISKLLLGGDRTLRDVTVFQIPHFSRGIYLPLKSGGRWVGRQLGIEQPFRYPKAQFKSS